MKLLQYIFLHKILGLSSRSLTVTKTKIYYDKISVNDINYLKYPNFLVTVHLKIIFVYYFELYSLLLYCILNTILLQHVTHCLF